MGTVQPRCIYVGYYPPAAQQGSLAIDLGPCRCGELIACVGCDDPEHRVPIVMCAQCRAKKVPR